MSTKVDWTRLVERREVWLDWKMSGLEGTEIGRDGRGRTIQRRRPVSMSASQQTSLIKTRATITYANCSH